MTLKNSYPLDASTKKNVNLWLEGDYDEKTKQEILKLLETNPKEITDSFYTTLTFGTGGLRGIMGVGTNRMNNYTVRAATQGLANYINKQQIDNPSVFIGYDSRKHSETFAEESAKVLAANGIKAYLCKDLRPTPFVSFGVRDYHCTAGIMVTASHNPANYNGYKVYWNDGAQVLPPHDSGIIEEVKKIVDPKFVKITNSLDDDLIKMVGQELDQKYIDCLSKLPLYPNLNQENGKQLKIVYTSLYGTGITLLPQVLINWGFNNLHYVQEQIVPNGDFPTTPYPNPEEKKALELGINLLQKQEADLLIATDPDADRVGVAVRHNGEVQTLTGNEMIVICLDHICNALVENKQMPLNAAFIKSVVTTELFQAICNHYQKPCFNVLTGFKYIAEKIREWDETKEYTYVFGGEESYGFLYGTQVRDKDAIISSAIICEAALKAKLEGKTLVDLLQNIWKKYGMYTEKLLSVNFPETKEGKEKMAKSMQLLEQKPPLVINNTEVAVLENYLTGIRINLKTQQKESIASEKSDLLIFWLTDGTKLMVRPSGTEPKIKIYVGVVNPKFHDVEEAKTQNLKKADEYLYKMKEILLS